MAKRPCACGCGQTPVGRLSEYMPGHRPPRDPQDRFWPKVDKTDTCWLWSGSTTHDGYGTFWLGDAHVLAHRFSLALAIGPLDPDLEVDHLCRVRHCVNPAHLEQVTHAENSRRMAALRPRLTHCRHGHALTPDNVYIHPTAGSRACRTCRTIQARQWRSA